MLYKIFLYFIAIGISTFGNVNPAIAQTAETGTSIPDVDAFETLLDYSFQSGVGGLRTCEYFVDELNEIQEKCTDLGSAFSATKVPQWAVPFQVQILTTKQAASDAYLKRVKPNQPIWQSRHVCGGALIHSDWVLTAAHCFKGSQKAKHYGAKLGADTISEGVNEYQKLEQIVLHPDFSSSPLDNDIALIKMKKSRQARNFSKYYSSGSTNEIGYWGAFPSANKKRLIVIPPSSLGEKYFSVWDIKRGKLIYEHKPSDEVHRETILDEKSRLLYGVDAIGAWVFHFDNDRKIHRLPNTKKYTQILLSRDKAKIITWSPKGEIEIRDTKKRRLIKSLNTGFPVSRMKYRGGLIVLSDYQDNEHVLDLDNMKITKSEQKLGWYISPDGMHALDHEQSLPVVSRIENNQLTSTRDVPITTPDYMNWVGESIFAGNDKYDMLINPNSLKILRQFPKSLGYEYDVHSDWILVKKKNGDATIFDPKTGQDLGNIAKVFDKITDENPDGDQVQKWEASHESVFANRTRLLSWTDKGKSKIWDIKSGRLLHEIDHSLGLSRVIISPDNRHIVGVSNFGPTDIFSVQTGEPVMSLFHRGLISARFSPNGKELLTWDRRGIAKVWSIKSGKEIGYVDIRKGLTNPPVEDIMVIPLADSEPKIGAPLWAYGWGRTANARKLDPVSILRMIEIYKISDDQCARKSGVTEASLGENEFCGADKTRKTCRGDSGGPISSSGKLVGIASWGSGNCGADGKPAGLSNVAHYKSWIMKTICADPDELANPSEFCQP